jgi:hypothetical protein
VSILSSLDPETDALRLRINDYRRFTVCDHRRLVTGFLTYAFGSIVLLMLLVERIINLDSLTTLIASFSQK